MSYSIYIHIYDTNSLFNLQILVMVVARQYGIKLTTWSYNPEKPKNCSAEDLADLRKMIVEESKCTNIPGKLQLFVKKPITGKGSQGEEENLADLRDLVDTSGSFDFHTLVERYCIGYHNPVTVKFPGR